MGTQRGGCQNIGHIPSPWFPTRHPRRPRPRSPRGSNPEDVGTSSAFRPLGALNVEDVGTSPTFRPPGSPCSAPAPPGRPRPRSPRAQRRGCQYILHVSLALPIQPRGCWNIHCLPFAPRTQRGGCWNIAHIPSPRFRCSAGTPESPAPAGPPRAWLRHTVSQRSRQPNQLGHFLSHLPRQLTHIPTPCTGKATSTGPQLPATPAPDANPRPVLPTISAHTIRIPTRSRAARPPCSETRPPPGSLRDPLHQTLCRDFLER